MLGEPDGAVHLRPQILEALSHAGDVMTIEDVYAHVLVGNMQLWLVHDAILFTEIVCYPRIKAIRAVIAAGCLEEIRKLVPRIARWAVSMGCERAEIVGRPGWARVLGKSWRAHGTIAAALMKDIARE